MIIIDGKKTAADLRLNLKTEVDNLKKKFDKVPGLTVILIGEYAPSKIYVRNKEKSAAEIGLKSEIVKYPETVDEKTVLKKISEFFSYLQKITQESRSRVVSRGRAKEDEKL